MHVQRCLLASQTLHGRLRCADKDSKLRKVKWSPKVLANRESASSQNPGLSDSGDPVRPPAAVTPGAHRVLPCVSVLCIYLPRLAGKPLREEPGLLFNSFTDYHAPLFYFFHVTYTSWKYLAWGPVCCLPHPARGGHQGSKDCPFCLPLFLWHLEHAQPILRLPMFVK